MTVGIPDTSNSSWRVKYVQKEKKEEKINSFAVSQNTPEQTAEANRKVGTPNPANDNKPFKPSPSPIPEKPKKGAKVLNLPRTPKGLPSVSQARNEKKIETSAQEKERNEFKDRKNRKYDPRRSVEALRDRLAESRVGQPVGGTAQAMEDQKEADKKEDNEKGKEKPKKKPMSKKEADKKLTDLKTQFKRSRKERGAKRIKEQERASKTPENKKWKEEESEKRSKEQASRKRRGKPTTEAFKPANLQAQNPNTQEDDEAKGKDGVVNEKKQEELRQANRKRMSRQTSTSGGMTERPARSKDPSVKDEPAVSRTHASAGGKERGRSVNPKDEETNPETGKKIQGKHGRAGGESPPAGREFERDVREGMEEPHTERKEDEKGNVTHHKRNPQLTSTTAEDEADQAEDKDKRIELQRPTQHGTKYSFNKPNRKTGNTAGARKRGERKEGEKGYGTSQSRDSHDSEHLGSSTVRENVDHDKKPLPKHTTGRKGDKKTQDSGQALSRGQRHAGDVGGHSSDYKPAQGVEEGEHTNVSNYASTGEDSTDDQGGVSGGYGSATVGQGGEDKEEKGIGDKAPKGLKTRSGGVKYAKPPKEFMRDTGKKDEDGKPIKVMTKVPESLLREQEEGVTQGAGAFKQQYLGGSDEKTGITAQEVHEATQGRGQEDKKDEQNYNEMDERKVPKGSKMEHKEVPQLDSKGKPRTYESQEVDEKGEKIRKPYPPRKTQQWNTEGAEKKKPKGTKEDKEAPMSKTDKLREQLSEKEYTQSIRGSPTKSKKYMQSSAAEKKKIREEWASKKSKNKSVAIGNSLELLNIQLNL
tara:strand:- start:3464 stop:5905 length:2442 start_codon:yes stop_codon:yes gene_type:complete